MTDVEMTEAELPLESAGARMLRAREESGMSRSQMAALTRIPERHLAAIEAGDFAALPARTYAVGFSRSYAKALGLDPEPVVAAVREELAAQQPADTRRTVQTFEPGDPARVPGARLAWFAGLGILAVVVIGYFAVRSMFAPGMTLPSILKDDPPAAAASQAAPPPAAPTPAGPVVFTATQPKVWVKFTDAAGNQLFQKELAQGESWTVPADAADVRIRTARPDALAITIGGQPVPPLSDVQTTISDVPVTAAALLARGTPAAVPAPAPTANAAPARSAAPQRQRERRAPAPAAGETGAPAAAATPEPVPAATAAPAPAATAT
ncbi:MAG TPA: helix-turn-helix domain-containing protein [Novosphingobium sp.]|nr:helix-turn-helix domain-containing protein [Novosphingobium sp.]